MKKYRVISIIFIIFLFSFSELVFSQPFGRGMGRGMGWWGAGHPYMGYLALGTANLVGYPNLLNLTQEQISRINEIQTRFQSENLSFMNSLNQKNFELQNLIIVQPPDQTAINAKIDEINKIQSELQKKVLAYTEDVRNILTEQQRVLINSNNLGYSWMLYPYGGGSGFGLRPRYGAGFGAGLGYPGYSGRNIWGGVRLGRGPCGLGIGRGAGWTPWWY